jgi:two-component system nitrogen regulation sensor histidine kinase NtrY
MSSVDQALAAEAAVAQSSATRIENRFLGRIAVIVALVCALITFAVLSDLTPLSPTHEVVVTLLAIDLLIVLILGALIGRELWLILQARRRGRAAARLHVRIIALFSLIAAAPAILVAIVASVTLDRGLDQLLSTRTRVMMENSLVMASMSATGLSKCVARHWRWLSNSASASACSIRIVSNSASGFPWWPPTAAWPSRR